MSIEYAEDRDLSRMVDRMVADYVEFAPLRENEVKILSAMKINMDDNQEAKECNGPAVTLKKLGGAERVYIKDHAHYLLLMDWTTWNSSNEIERERTIHPALKKIGAGKDKKDKLKLTVVRPDVVTYFDTARRYGNTMEELATVHQCVAHSRKVVQMVEEIDKKDAADAAKPKPKPAPAPIVEEETHEEGPANGVPAPEEDAAPEPEEEAPIEEEVLSPPPRVNKRASKP